MPIISITRLHLRSLRYMPMLSVFTLGSALQARRSDGFLGGLLGGDAERGAWTMTAWRDEAAMRSFRDNGIHRKAMPRLLNWCDGASFAHWQQTDATLPAPDEAHRRMGAEGRLSKVYHPSPAHAAGETTSKSLPKPGLRFVPHAKR